MQAWSYSALTSFETCPLRHYKIKVQKSVVDVKGEAAQWGLDVHKAMELRVKEGKPLPPSMIQWEPLAKTICKYKAGATIITEQQIAIDENFNVVKWFAKNVWCRAVMDLAVYKDTSMLIVDYKTGKVKPDSKQLALAAGFGFAKYPEIETITTCFAWLKTKEVEKDTFTRDDVSKIWRSFLPRVAEFQKAYDDQEWNPKPSGLCRKHCPIVQCIHNGK